MQDRLSQVTQIFQAQMPTQDYALFPKGSARNRLLAHYLVESLPYSVMEAVMAADSGAECIPKLAIINEVSLLTGYAELTIRSWNDKIRLGSILPTSSLDKVVAMAGLNLFGCLAGKGQKPDLKAKKADLTRQQSDVDYLSQHKAFAGISEGANPEHAAACYLQLLIPDDGEAYDARLQMSVSASDMRRLLAFKQYHERTALQRNKEDNLNALADHGVQMDEVFLRAVLNWNKDVLQRLLLGSCLP